VAHAARIDDLRRRLQKDPASILFAQLAEEHRRTGDFETAIRICRSGLALHPAYLSARVTLGRALIEVGQLDDAAGELRHVLRIAPDNLAASRALDDLEARRRRGAALPPAIQADRVLPVLEAWLDRILSDRARRRART
jgi:tetratricopeptide (TPR) repeat protein